MEIRGGQLERGSVVGGYRVDSVISRGGMGVVYRVTNVALHKVYALKTLTPDLTDDAQFRDRFRREMRIAASIEHPNVVGIHYAGEHNGLLFLVMDLIVGTDLRHLVQESGALEPDRAVDLLEQFAFALDAAHAKGLVHRDVKPANMLVTVRDGQEHGYLTDFGIAKRSDNIGALTSTGAVVGTVHYMAPEQVTGDPTDARTDVYALGCVFFQMLTGAVPYDRENSIATLFAHVHDPPPALPDELADLYPTFGAVIEKAMAKKPEDRHLSAGDFARDAACALGGIRYTGPATIVATGDASRSCPTRTRNPRLGLKRSQHHRRRRRETSRTRRPHQQGLEPAGTRPGCPAGRQRPRPRGLALRHSPPRLRSAPAVPAGPSADGHVATSGRRSRPSSFSPARSPRLSR